MAAATGGTIVSARSFAGGVKHYGVINTLHKLVYRILRLFKLLENRICCDLCIDLVDSVLNSRNCLPRRRFYRRYGCYNVYRLQVFQTSKKLNSYFCDG